MSPGPRAIKVTTKRGYGRAARSTRKVLGLLMRRRRLELRTSDDAETGLFRSATCTLRLVYC